jgi:radical SAM superfamily enzyme YgiQ (UPF0313 family)
MKVFILGINARYTHSNPALLYLRNEILAAGQSAEIAEFSINDEPLSVLESIASKQPDVVMISVYIWNGLFVERFLSDVKKICPLSKVYLGGPEAGYNSQQWLKKYPFIDGIIQGAGEQAVSELALAGFEISGIETGEILSPEKKVLRVKNRPFTDIPSPYIESDFAGLEHRHLYYESSRGCPFECSYCLSSREDQCSEYKSAEQTIEELSFLLSHDPMTVKFVDRSFNAHPERARKIWNFCAGHKGRTAFHFEIHPLLLEEADYQTLAAVEKGKFRFEIGIQSVNPEPLEAIHRNAQWDIIEPKIRRIINLGNIHTHLDMIAGLPFETLDGIARSFNRIISLGADHFQFGFLKILPGTEMSEKAAEYGMIFTETPPYQILSNRWVSVREMNLLRAMEHVLDGFYCGGLHGEMMEAVGLPDPFSCYRRITEFMIEEKSDLRIRQKTKLIGILQSFKDRESTRDNMQG